MSTQTIPDLTFGAPSQVQLPVRRPPVQATQAAAGAVPDLTFGPGRPPLGPISALVRSGAERYGIPYELAIRLVRQESGGKPRAVSPKGAVGIMQVLPGTGAKYGYSRDDLFDPKKNIDAGMRYLAEQFDRFKSWELALAAYNAGPGAVSKYGGIPPYRETQNYVRVILRDLPELRREFGTVREVVSRTQREFEDIPRAARTGEMINIPIGKITVPVPAALLKTLQSLALGSQVIESALTGGAGYREAFRRAGLPDTGSFGPAAIAAGIMAGVLDPINLVALGSGFLTTSGRRALQEAARIRAVQRGQMVRPRPEAQIARELVSLEAREQAAIAAARPTAVPRVSPIPERPVVLERPAPAKPKIGQLDLEEPAPKVTPVERAPVRERVPTPAERTAAAAQRKEEVTARVSEVRARGGLLRPEPRQVPDLIFPGKAAPRGKVIRISEAPARPGKPAPGAAAAEPIAPPTPSAAERVQPSAAVPEAGFVRPVEVVPRVGRALPLRQGDVVLYARDGDTYRIERIGPRGYGLVDVQTGRKRPNVMHDDLAKTPDLLQQVDPRTGQLIETRPIAPKLTLAGEEVEIRPEIGRQEGLEASAALQRQLAAEDAARKAAARAARRPGVSKKPVEEQTIGQAIRSMGGVSIEQSSDIAGELEAVMRQRRFPPGVIVRRRSVRTWAADDIAKSLNESGFRHPDGREIEGADIPGLLESEFMGRQPKSRFLHPAATGRFEEAAIRKVEHRAALESEGVYTSNVGQYLDLPDREQVATLKALGRAMAELGEPDSPTAIEKVAGRATEIYNRELLPKLGKRAAVQSPKFFKDVLRADLSESGLPTSPTAARRIVTDPDLPLKRRLDVSNEHVDMLADEIDGVESTVEQKAKQSLIQRLKDESGFMGFHGDLIEPTIAATRGIRGAVRALISQADSVVDRMGKDGHALLMLRNRMLRDYKLASGEITAKLHRLRSVSDESWNRVREFSEGQQIALTPEERALYAQTKAYYTDVLPRARRVGLEPGELEFYWPIRINEDIATRRITDAVREIMARTGADEERALELLRRWRRDARTGRPFGNLERERKAWAPYWVRKSAKQEFFEYLNGAERRIAEAAHFGPRDERFNRLLEQIRDRDPMDGAFTEAWFDAETRRTPREVFLEETAKQILNVQTASKMVLSVISNASQPVNNLLIVDVGTFMRGYGRILNGLSRAEAIDFARRSGAVLETTLKELVAELGTEEGVGGKVLRRTGFLTVEGGNRTVTAVIGREWARDLAGALVRSEADRPSWIRNHKLETIRRHLWQIDLDPDEITKAGGKLTDRQERIAALKLVELTQFPMNPGALPLWWSSPWGRVATQFKRFAYKQGQLIYRSIVDEAKHGNFKPLAVFLSVFPLVGEMVADGRLLLRRFPESITEPGKVLEERPRSFFRRMAENMAYVGGIGLASDLIRALERREPREAVSSFLGGPTFQEAMSFVLNMRELLGLSAGARRIRGVKRTARQAVGLTVTPGLTAAFGLPGAVAGEAIESAEIFKTLPFQRGRRRRRRG